MIELLTISVVGVFIWGPIGGLIGLYKNRVVLGVFLGILFGIFGVIGMCFIPKDNK